MVNVPDEQLNVPFIETGRYQHYKGNFYEVIGVALDSENVQPLVVYTPLYDTKVKLWARPYEMFMSSVVMNGVEVPRFKKVD